MIYIVHPRNRPSADLHSKMGQNPRAEEVAEEFDAEGDSSTREAIIDSERAERTEAGPSR